MRAQPPQTTGSRLHPIRSETWLRRYPIPSHHPGTQQEPPAFAFRMDAVAPDHSTIPFPVASEAALPFALHDWLAGVDAAVAVFVARDEATLRLLAQTMPIIAPERRV